MTKILEEILCLKEIIIIMLFHTNDVGDNPLIGGIAGSNEGSRNEKTVIINSYYDSTKVVEGDLGFGVGLLPQELKNKSNFDSWDFDGIWDMDSDINGGFPFLRHFRELC